MIQWHILLHHWNRHSCGNTHTQINQYPVHISRPVASVCAQLAGPALHIMVPIVFPCSFPCGVWLQTGRTIKDWQESHWRCAEVFEDVSGCRVQCHAAFTSALVVRWWWCWRFGGCLQYKALLMSGASLYFEKHKGWNVSLGQIC